MPNQLANSHVILEQNVQTHFRSYSIYGINVSHGFHFQSPLSSHVLSPAYLHTLRVTLVSEVHQENQEELDLQQVYSAFRTQNYGVILCSGCVAFTLAFYPISPIRVLLDIGVNWGKREFQDIQVLGQVGHNGLSVLLQNFGAHETFVGATGSLKIFLESYFNWKIKEHCPSVLFSRDFLV